MWFRDYVFWGCKTQDYAGYTPVANKRGLIVSKNFYIRYGVDYKRDFWTMAWYFDWFVGFDLPESQSTQQQLQKEFFWREPKNYRKVNRFDQMPPYPLIYEEKVSRWRKGVAQIESDLKKKMKARNEMWVKRGGYDAWGWAKRTKFQDVQ